MFPGSSVAALPAGVTAVKASNASPATEVAEKLKAVVNNQKTLHATTSSPAGPWGTNMFKLVGLLGVGALASHLGAPELVARAEVIVPLAALAIFGKNGDAPEAVDEHRQRASTIFDQVLSVFSRKDQARLIEKIAPFADQLQLGDFVKNIYYHFNQPGQASVADLIHSMPVKQWAAEKAIAERNEVRRLNNGDMANAIVGLAAGLRTAEQPTASSLGPGALLRHHEAAAAQEALDRWPVRGMMGELLQSPVMQPAPVADVPEAPLPAGPVTPAEVHPESQGNPLNVLAAAAIGALGSLSPLGGPGQGAALATLAALAVAIPAPASAAAISHPVNLPPLADDDLQLAPQVRRPFTLNNATGAGAQAVLDAAARQWELLSGSLDTSQQRQFVEATREALRRDIQIANQVQAGEGQFETLYLPGFEQALHSKFGMAVDPKTCFLKTYYRQGERPDEHGKNDRFSENSVSLWEAAKMNYDWRKGGQSINDRNTEVVDAQGQPVNTKVTAERVIDVIRRQNIGNTRKEDFASVQAVIAPLRQAQVESRWQRDCLDLMRRVPEGAELGDLSTALSSKAWKAFSLALGSGAPGQGEGAKVKLPLLVFTQGNTTYSYFPGRPDGPLQVHFSEQAAVADFNEKIIADGSAGKLHWLAQALSQPDQLKLQRFLQQPAQNVDTRQLNAVARFLHDTFACEPVPQPERLFLINEPVPRKPLPLSNVLGTYQDQRLEANWNHGFRSTGEADKAGFAALGDEAVRDILELLSLPVSPLGMNHVMQAVMLGGLGYQSLEAGIQLQRGNSVEAIQAAADFTDLLVNGKLQNAAHVLNQRQVDGLIRAMGSPESAKGRQTGQLWWRADELAAYLLPEAQAVAGIADGDGIITQQGRALAPIDFGGKRRFAEVEFDPSIQAYRLIGAGEGAYRPPLRHDPAGQVYQVQIGEEANSLSASQLLKLMLPPELRHPGLGDEQLQQILKFTGTDRELLAAIWQGSAAASLQLVDAVAGIRHSVAIDSAIAYLRSTERVPTGADDSILLPALAAKHECTLAIHTPDGKTPQLFKGAPRGKVPVTTIELMKLNDGEYTFVGRPAGNVRSAAPMLDVPNQDSLIRCVEASLPGAPQRAASAAQIIDSKLELAGFIEGFRATLFEVMRAEKTQGAVGRDDPAYVFTPAVEPQWMTSNTDVHAVRRRHPELSINSALRLLAEHSLSPGSLPRDPKLWPKPFAAACADTAIEVRIDRALASLSSATGDGLTLDGEALICKALASQETLPVQVRVYGPGAAGPLLASYGEPGSGGTLDIIRGGNNQYLGKTSSFEQVPGPAGANPLAGALLCAMTDEQRVALGIEIFDIRPFVERVAAFYGHPVHEQVAQAVLMGDGGAGLKAGDVEWYHATRISLKGLRPGPDGRYQSADGKSYVKIDGKACQVKSDSTSSGDGSSILRLVRQGSAQANSASERYQAELGYGMPVKRGSDGQWRPVLGLGMRAGGLGSGTVREHMLPGADKAVFDGILRTLDPSTGAFKMVGTLGGYTHNVGFDLAKGLFFSMENPTRFFQVDKANPSAKLIGYAIDSSPAITDSERQAVLKGLGINLELPLVAPLAPASISDIPARISHIWVGPKAIPEHLIENMELNAKQAKAGARPYEATLYLSNANGAAFDANSARLRESAPSLNVVALEATPFFQSFKESDSFTDFNKAVNGAAKNYAVASDVLRYPLVNHFGGIYMDTDDHLLSPPGDIDIKLASNGLALAGAVSSEKIGAFHIYPNSFIASHPNNPTLNKVSALSHERARKHPEVFDKAMSSFKTADEKGAHGRTVLEVTGPLVLDEIVKRELPDLYRAKEAGKLLWGPKVNFLLTAQEGEIVHSMLALNSAVEAIVDVGKESSWAE